MTWNCCKIWFVILSIMIPWYYVLTDKAAVSQDAAAELERMRRTKKAIPEVKPNGPDSTATWSHFNSSYSWQL